jgi:hypothetical protein
VRLQLAHPPAGLVKPDSMVKVLATSARGAAGGGGAGASDMGPALVEAVSD